MLRVPAAAAGVILCALAVAGLPAQQPPAQPAAAAQAPAAGPPKLAFTSPAGALLVPIKPDQTAVFEEYAKKLKAGLAASTDPTLKQQAAGTVPLIIAPRRTGEARSRSITPRFMSSMYTVPAQAAEMCRLAQAKKVVHAVGTQARFSPGIMYGKALMEEAYVGKPLLYHMTHFLSGAVEPRPSHRWWSMRAEEGGGALLIALGHALDVVRWYLGDVEAVCGSVQTLVPETRFADTGEVVRVDAIDTVACMARLAGGLSGTVHVSNACKGGGGFRLEVYGIEGRLLVESSHMVQYSPARVYGARGNGPLQELPIPDRFYEVTELAADSQAFQVAQLLRRCLQAVAVGEEFHPNFVEAVALHRTIEALVHSSKSGTWIELA